MIVKESWATGEEARTIQDLVRDTIHHARQEGWLPSQVGGEFEVEYGEDPDGSPAAWIWILVQDDPQISEEEAKLLKKLSEEIEQAILGFSPRHWPYIAYGKRRQQ